MEGTAYPIPTLNIALANIVAIARNAVILFALGGDALFNALNASPYGTSPMVQQAFALYKTHISPNKIGWMAGSWFLGNIAANSLMSTGAFEIYANGILVFSKIKTGRLPTPEEFWGGLEQALGRPRSH